MTFQGLKSFLESKMRMSHIYQPVMIKHLLEQGGNATDKEIAHEISKYDQSQIEYYQKITNNMVGRVLRSHNIVERQGNSYTIDGFNNLTTAQILELKSICETKLDEYIKKRGQKIWEHRSTLRGYISGSIKYEVLKRAQFRCELCGISADEKALEVDHIEPKNLGGEDSINNYQALCYSCNAMKRDTDNTDFRGNADKYHKRQLDCPFCEVKQDRIIKENNLGYLIFDKFPVTEHHSLIIPKRHYGDYFETTQAELNAISFLLNFGKDYLSGLDGSIRGFNIGINSGAVAGQTVPHCHTHLIPRRDQDVDDPRGGVRHIIPDKGLY
ncbi:MAG: HIT domain-containing protein [Bacteroidales bacterium]